MYSIQRFYVKFLCLCIFGVISPTVMFSQQITVSTQVELINQRNRDIVTVNQL